MTSLAVEHLRTPSSRREARALAYAEEWAVDDLATRTVWCATGLSRAQHSAQAMQDQLREVGEHELAPRELHVAASEPLLDLTERLDAMLHEERVARGPLGPADNEICAEAMADSDVLVGERIRAGDLVVLHDPLAVMLAEAVRERGAHAVWYLDIRGGPARSSSMRARLFLQEYTWPVDACVMAARRSADAARGGQRLVALIRSADLVAVKEADATPASEAAHREHLAWASTLADVIRTDRAETVGGTLQVRPAVPAR